MVKSSNYQVTSSLNTEDVEEVKRVILDHAEGGWVFSLNNGEFVEDLRNTSIPALQEMLENAELVVGRCMSVQTNKYAYSIHFDNYKSTKVTVIEGEDDGRLYVAKCKLWDIFPSVLHLLPKLFLQNALSQRVLRSTAIKRHFFTAPVINIGQTVEFDGSTVLHFNEPASERRISLIVHKHRKLPMTLQTMFESLSLKWTGQKN